MFSVPLSVASIYPLAWGLPMGMEWIVIGLIALLIFGKRLPGVAKGIGQGIMEFKRGVKSGDHEEDAVGDAAPQIPAANGDAVKPRFDPHTGKPLA